jgi:hypothetical protein
MGLVSGGLFLLFLGFVVVIAVPTLRRELPPPEISGPDRVSRNASVPPPLETPGTATGSSSRPTSGTHTLLNLDDFPHLSPTMRNLTRDWLDQCAETDQALEAIPDPALRARAVALLKNRGKINELLSRPLEWGKGTDWMEEEAQNLHKRDAVYGEYFTFNALCMIRYFPGRPSEYKQSLRDSSGFDPRKADELIQLLEKCPAFASAIAKEADRLWGVSERMGFESYVYHCKWYLAVEQSYIRFRMIEHSPDAPSSSEESVPVVSLEEEMYCLRQLGIPGKVGMVARTSQQAIRSHLKNRVSKYAFDRIALYEMGEDFAGMVMEVSVLDPAHEQESQDIRLINEEGKKECLENNLNNAAPVPEKTIEERNPIQETNQTLETREATRGTSSTQETSSSLGIGI